MARIDDAIVPEGKTIKEAMKSIDRSGLGIAFVVDSAGKLLGVATDGDVRRAILKGTSLDENIKSIMNNSPITAVAGLPKDELVKTLASRKDVAGRIPVQGTLKVPVLDEDGVLKDVVFVSSEQKGKSLKMKPDLEKKDVLKKILVIGGAGYVGSVLVRQLLEKGYKVKVFDMLLHGDNGIKELYGDPNFEFVSGNVLHIDDVANAMKGADAVVHLAAIVGDPAGKMNPESTIEINYLATKTIVEMCKYYQINRFIFASTCSVYGASSGDVIREGDAVNPVSLYGRTKLESENSILDLAGDNFSPTILRFATVYGMSKRMRFDLVVNVLTAKAVNEGTISIFGGKQWRPLIHVSDFARAVVSCIEAPIEKVGGQVFNVGSNEQNYQMSELGELIRKAIPGTKVNVVKDKEDERSYRVSFDKIRNTLGFTATKTVEDGVHEIKNAFDAGEIGDYRDAKYNNLKPFE